MPVRSLRLSDTDRFYRSREAFVDQWPALPVFYRPHPPRVAPRLTGENPWADWAHLEAWCAQAHGCSARRAGLTPDHLQRLARTAGPFTPAQLGWALRSLFPRR